MATILMIIRLLITGLATVELAASVYYVHWYTNHVYNLKTKNLNADPNFQTLLTDDRMVKMANFNIKLIYYWTNFWHIAVTVVTGALFVYNLKHNQNQLIMLDLVIGVYAAYDFVNSTFKIAKHKRIPNYYEKQTEQKN